MSNPGIRFTRILLNIGLSAIIVCGAPASLGSQEVSSSLQAREAASRPFVRYDEALIRVADTLLSSAAQIPSASGTEANISETRIANSFKIDTRSWALRARVSSDAMARLALLRPAVDPILERHGVPADLAAVILVESGGRATALSPKGARGFWQLMPDTARRYGLHVDIATDDRIDLLKATEAAAGYLHDLYVQFGDWRLALAAYNTGEANVGFAIQKGHTPDFDQLSRLGLLPLETRNYVPRVVGAAQAIGPLDTFGEVRRAVAGTTVFAVNNR
jgi:hypothetical protein